MEAATTAKPAEDTAQIPRVPNGSNSIVYEEPPAFWSVKFVIFAVVVLGAATAAGLVQSGRVSLKGYFGAKTAALTQFHSAPAAPVPPPKAGAFVVTSISLGQPSFAIINGTSRTEGDSVAAAGAPGWKVKRVVDGAVWLQNGPTVVSIPLSTPGIKPLDDQLHPLN